MFSSSSQERGEATPPIAPRCDAGFAMIPPFRTIYATGTALISRWKAVPFPNLTPSFEITGCLPLPARFYAHRIA